VNYIIAGNRRQAMDLVREKGWGTHEYYYCDRADRMRGRAFRKGDTWWVTGTPMDRPDIGEIWQQKHMMEFWSEV
jgi:hypothetical protein